MVSVLVVGYKAFDLGIFGDKDQRLKIIKAAIRRDLIYLLENGMKWLVFTGNLGFEVWVLEVAKELQEEYNFQLATIFIFENQGENWNEANQEKLANFKNVDFIKYAYPSYENPSQFRTYNQFLLESTDGAYLFYDEENETKLKYLYRMMKENKQYHIKKLTFDDLNEMAENFSEI
ncbi:DUF1273 domain-containing protein [Streptococcus gordonii]|uniref:UPF0398 protein SGO_0588 n=3 Tax=Streptococcus gordonii TaxID=1302 RepID=Y588_STRGC|nr:DUF1273 domain-containing protein [Streptococcus gordonii]A8AVU4.1 RecName: Full=UPF0398 protein SGO_0588 [Streptococcus gordonii str. Challis substr. CH1]ABV09401.1 conserved hypothetical protein [Streptococcus gordonii str. Challis substr. CH1]KJQ65608.1 hypothetical protein TZ88_00301 [Streptococcus gordonii]MBZ2136744.1 DUF1273 domain-containing protein [Streptococcus gordonii]MCG4821721.1 DUF1273 domain-containing protein [Streptococcus gordonii]MCG4847079.1 DUF1273 domain-containing 